jgi:hypothetical protein
MVISDGVLRVEPAQHFATEAEARAAVDPFLREWEAGNDLRHGVERSASPSRTRTWSTVTRRRLTVVTS